jgi:hypothetical protein
MGLGRARSGVSLELFRKKMSGSNSGIRQLASDVPGGRSHVFAAWIRPTSTDQTFELGVELPDASIIKTSAANLPVGTSRWTRMFVKFELPEGSHPVTAFIRKTSADSSDAYFDEAFLIESFANVVAPPEPGIASRFIASEDTTSPGGGTTNLAEEYTLALQETSDPTDSSKPYIRFNLQSLAGRSIDQATLRLCNTGDHIYWRLAVQEVTGTWTTTGPDYLTSSNRPAVGVTVATIEQQGGRAMLSSADLTDHLRQRLTADAIVSLTLDDLNNSGAKMTIASSEWITNAPPTLNDSPAIDIIFSLPPAPTALEGTVTWNSIDLTWSGSPDSLSYEIRRADSAQGPFTLLGTVTSPAFSDATITPGASYVYNVTGVNESGVGETSGLLLVTGVPSNLITTITTTGAAFDLNDGTTWDDYLGNDIVPNNSGNQEFAPIFDEAGVYTAPTASVFNWAGMAFDVSGVEINPDGSGNAVTINLGTSGISGSEGVSRLGSNLTLNVGANDQIWAVSAGNVQAMLTGTSNVTLAGSSYWFRGNNSGFTGTWSLTNGSSIRTSDNNSIGGAGVAVDLDSGTTLRLAGGNNHGTSLNLKGTNGTLRVGAGLATTINGGASGGTLLAPATLTLNPDNGTANSLNLNGTLADHVGPLVIDLTNITEDFTTTLGSNAEDEFSFAIGADKIVDGVDTTRVPLIAAGVGAGVSNLVLNHTLTIDTIAAAIADGNSWNLIDTTHLMVSTGASFNVRDFVANGNTWTRTEDSNTWTLDMDTGVLTLTSFASGFASWIAGTFANGVVSLQGPNDDDDGDGIVNLLEYAFDTDPTVGSPVPLAHADGIVSAHGQPVVSTINGLDHHAVFLRRMDHASSGLTYTVQFSADLSAWADSGEIPTVIASDATIEAVSVPFPPIIAGIEEPTFFRVKIGDPNASDAKIDP